MHTAFSSQTRAVSELSLAGPHSLACRAATGEQQLEVQQQEHRFLHPLRQYCFEPTLRHHRRRLPLLVSTTPAGQPASSDDDDQAAS